MNYSPPRLKLGFLFALPLSSLILHKLIECLWASSSALFVPSFFPTLSAIFHRFDKSFIVLSRSRGSHITFHPQRSAPFLLPNSCQRLTYLTSYYIIQALLAFPRGSAYGLSPSSKSVENPDPCGLHKITSHFLDAFVLRRVTNLTGEQAVSVLFMIP